jgi:uncharacterized protein (TIGR03435 family)
MKPSLICVAVFALLTGAIFSQAPERVAFEAAEIHEVETAGLLGPIAGINGASMTGPFIGGGLYRLRSGTMMDLIATAYGVTADKVAGGPAWIAFNRYDIIAKIPPGATAPMLKTMLQTLLADRFKLAVHSGESPVTVWGVKASAKPSLKPSDGSGESGCKSQPLPASALITNGAISYACRNITMQGFADGVKGMVGANLLAGNSVVDQTNLKGSWNFDITFRRSGSVVPAGEERLYFFDAVAKQLGLEIALTKVPMPALVVDRVDERPTGNTPNPTLLASLPLTFEVAEIKPMAPDNPNRNYNMRVLPGGRLQFTNIPLAALIQRAWELHRSEFLVGPKFLEAERVDVVAQIPALEGTEAAGANAGKQDDLVNAMLRSLIIERYKVVFHQENRPFTAYTLKAVKPKLRKADPSNRSGCFRGTAGADAVESAAMRVNSEVYDCRNMTMAQLATFLRNSPFANNISHASVLDGTGLEGGWDFTLAFSPETQTATIGDSSMAAAPTSRVTLTEAIESQLGLKLETSKRPASVLVIDHMEQKPLP